jgi:hypothetical protein
MLFGHQNDDANQPVVNVPVPPTDGVNPLAVDPVTGASLPVVPAEPPVPPEPSEPSILNQHKTPFADSSASVTSLPDLDAGAAQTDTSMPSGAPAVQSSSDNMSSPFSTVADSVYSAPPAADEVAAEPQVSDSQPQQSTSALDDNNATDLLSLKQQALTQLQPLVDQLDQTPEEKFRTTMMLIQSTDNQSLIQDAYDTAQTITDEKVRAQALLDVINEINYFTQQSSKN